MANLLNRVAKLEQRTNPEALGMPYTFIVLKAGEKPEGTIVPRTVIFEIIKPSGDAHATQPKQQPEQH